MKLLFRLSTMTFMLMLSNTSYSMNQPANELPPLFSQRTIFRNCIIDVNQNYELNEANRMTELLNELLISLAPGQQNLQYFPLITILRDKDNYFDSIEGRWTPSFKQAELRYKNHYALTSLLQIKPSHATSQALSGLIQFASDMKCENLTISIRPIIPQQPINLKLKDQVITEEAQLDKLKAELAQSEAELDARLEKNKLEFNALKESTFPTTTRIVQIAAAPEPQPIARELANAGWRHMSVAQTPTQILAPKKLPNKPVLTVFKPIRPSPAYKALARTLQEERVAKLVNAAQTPPQSPSANQF